MNIYSFLFLCIFCRGINYHLLNINSGEIILKKILNKYSYVSIIILFLIEEGEK